MPQAIPMIIAGAQAAYAAAVSYTAQAIMATGLSSILPAGSVYAVSAATVNLAIQVGASAIIGAATRPNIPDPDFARSTRKQTVPPRVSGYGTARIGGDFMLWEAVNEYAYNVVASHDGLINGWTKYYLNDKPVVVSGTGYVQRGEDDRYGDGTLVRIASRKGLPTETRYSEITSTSLWPSTARGDGIASLMMIARAGKAEYFLADYPNGLPIPSGVGELQLCWDPRLGARGTIVNDASKLASATWQWTENPALHLLDYMTNPMTGMGLPVAKFLPLINDWIEAANVCDEAVPLKAGGTEKRYRGGGIYLHTTDHADVIATIRSCCDGWLGQDTNGNYTFQAGKYYEPTVIIEDRHIISARLDRFKKDEESINQVVVTFTDPTFDYSQVETNPIENAADIIASGVIRPQPITLPWVQSSSQAQRLGKAMLYKASAPFSGTITTTLDGLRAWGERRIRIRMPSEGARFADFVADVLPITINPDMTVTIPFTAYVPETYQWSTAEEGDGPGGSVSPPVVGVPLPVINSVSVFESSVGGATGVRLRVVISPPGRDDLVYSIRWRTTGTTVWNEETPRPAVLVSGALTIDSGFVPSVPSLDVQIRASTGGGRSSEWTATTTTNSSYSDAVQTILNAYLDRVTSQPSDAQKTRLRTMLTGWNNSQALSDMEGLHILASYDSQSALLDVLNPTVSLTPVASPTFATYKGYTGNGTSSYLQSSFNPATATKLSQNDNSVSIYVLTNVASTAAMIGSSSFTINGRSNIDQSRTRNSSTTTDTAASTDSRGLWTVSRRNSSNYDLFHNGALVQTFTRASAAISSLTFRVCGWNDGSPQFSSAQIAIASWGKSRTLAQELAVYNATTAYLTAIGAV